MPIDAQRGEALHQKPLFVQHQSVGVEVMRLPRLINGRDHAVAGSDQTADACHDFMQDRIKIKVLVDTQYRCTQFGEALAQRLVLRFHLVGFIH